MRSLLPSLLLICALAVSACSNDAATDRQTSQPSATSNKLSNFSATDLPEIDIPYEKHVLDNGLTLILHEDHKTPIVAVNVWYHVGSKDEQPGKTGFAHLFEHLMFNGSENYDDEFFRPLEEVGATDMNGTTNTDRTNYFANVPVGALDRLLWMESDRMGNLLGAITQAKLDEQRGVVQNEKRQRENAPYGKVWELIVENTYPEGHPYSWSVIGSMEDLNAASLEDVHDWFKRYYGAANATIVIAGDIDPDKVKKRVEHYFGGIDGGPPLTRQQSWVAKMQGEHRLVTQDRVPQARIYKVWNVPGVADLSLAQLDIASDILAGGKTSRLYERLVYREQIATDVSAFLYSKELGSQFIISASAKPGQDLEAIEAAIDEELQRFLNEGPKGDELQRIKTSQFAGFVKGMERIGGFGGKSDILARSQVFGGNPDAFQAYLDALRTADANSVQTTAEQWLSDGVFVLQVLPFEEGKTLQTEVDRSQLPKAGNPPALSLPDLQRFELGNGLQVVLAQRQEVPVVQMSLVFDAGYAADTAHSPGTASMALAMLDEGTEKYDALALNEAQQRLGASISTSSSLDSSSINLSALSNLLDPSLDLYAEVVRRPAFPEKELERLKQQRLASIAQEKARPMTLGLRVLPPLLYGEAHAYSQPLTGSGDEQSTKALKIEDLQGFYQNWIRPDNASLVVVGDTSVEELKPLLEKHFGDWQPPEHAAPKKTLNTVERPAKPRIYLMDRPGAEQSVIIAGHVIPPRGHDQDIALETLNSILGGMFTSRLNMNLREDKHWAYGARSLIMDAQGQRPFLAYAPVQADKTAPAMQEILKELTQIKGPRPTKPTELKAAQDNLTLKLPGQHETTGQVLGSLVEQLIYALPDDYYNQYVTRVRDLEAPDMRASAELLHPSQLTWVVVGDLGNIEAPVRQLGMGEVHILDKDGKAVK